MLLVALLLFVFQAATMRLTDRISFLLSLALLYQPKCASADRCYGARPLLPPALTVSCRLGRRRRANPARGLGAAAIGGDCCLRRLAPAVAPRSGAQLAAVACRRQSCSTAVCSPASSHTWVQSLWLCTAKGLEGPTVADSSLLFLGPSTRCFPALPSGRKDGRELGEAPRGRGRRAEDADPEAEGVH